MCESKNTENTFFGNVSNVQIQQNTSHSTQTMIDSSAYDYEKAISLLKTLRAESNNYGLEDSDKKTILEVLESIQKDVSEEKNPSMIKKGFSIVKEVLMKTGTTLAATGAIQLISNFLENMS